MLGSVGELELFQNIKYFYLCLLLVAYYHKKKKKISLMDY